MDGHGGREHRTGLAVRSDGASWRCSRLGLADGIVPPGWPLAALTVANSIRMQWI